jgi:hypothetical protein
MTRWRVMCAAAGAVGILVAAQAIAGDSYNPRQDLAARYPDTVKIRRDARPRLSAIHQRLAADEAAGRDVTCARQMQTEVLWRFGYTADVAAAQALLARTEAVVDGPHPPSGGAQAADGSYGACSEPWFLRLDASTDQLLDPTGWHGALPPRFLDRINAPDRLARYLDEMLISDIARDGIDRRKELNLATSVLVRMILRDRPAGHLPTAELRPVLHDFVARWQDPETGFFGAWYRVGDRLVKRTDLSLTFHMAKYFDGRIGHWPALIDTLLAMKDGLFPVGWLDDDGMSSHNNYDVAVLFRLGWPSMRPDQRLAARAEIERMLAWCLERGLEPDGRVRQTGNNESLPDTYYFTAAFLDTVGAFDPRPPFWRDAPLPDLTDLRLRMGAQLERFDRTNGMVSDALRRLRIDVSAR